MLQPPDQAILPANGRASCGQRNSAVAVGRECFSDNRPDGIRGVAGHVAGGPVEVTGIVRLKILLVAPQPFYVERGTPIAVRLLATTLCEFGHSVDLLAYHAGSEIQVPGLRIFRARRPPGVGHVPIGISWQKLVCDLFLVARMFGLLRRNRYDVVHAVEESLFPAVVFNLCRTASWSTTWIPGCPSN